MYYSSPIESMRFLCLLTETMVNMPKNHSVFAKKPWKMPNLLGNKGFSTTFAEYIYIRILPINFGGKVIERTTND